MTSYRVTLTFTEFVVHSSSLFQMVAGLKTRMPVLVFRGWFAVRMTTARTDGLSRLRPDGTIDIQNMQPGECTARLNWIVNQPRICSPC